MPLRRIRCWRKSCEKFGFVVGMVLLFAALWLRENIGAAGLAGIAIIVSLLLFWKSEKKQAAVGRREMQILLIGYMVVSFAEIFTVGGFLENQTILKVEFSHWRYL